MKRSMMLAGLMMFVMLMYVSLPARAAEQAVEGEQAPQRMLKLQAEPGQPGQPPMLRLREPGEDGQRRIIRLREPAGMQPPMLRLREPGGVQPRMLALRQPGGAQPRMLLQAGPGDAPRMLFAQAGPGEPGQPGPRMAVRQRMVKAAFLGVTTRPVMPELTAQLELPRGVGLVVTFIEPDSPAAKAGLREHDVLHKLGDQLLINAEQLSVLVRTYKPEDDVTLNIIRGGKKLDLTATLEEREVPELLPGGGQIHRMFPLEEHHVRPLPQREAAPRDRQDMEQQQRELLHRLEQMRHPEHEMNLEQLQQQIQQMIEGLMGELPGDMFEQPERMGQLPRGLGDMMQQQMQMHIGPGGAASMNMKWQDDEHVLSLQRQGDEPGKLTVTTRDGEVVYQGDMPKENELDQVPAEIRGKVARMIEMSQHHNFRIEIGPGLRGLPRPDSDADPLPAPRID